MTADAAVRGIRQRDAHGSVGLISTELDPPYDRPPLSKGLWQGTPLEKVWRGTLDHDAALHLGRSATTLAPATRQVIDDQHTIYTFDKIQSWIFSKQHGHSSGAPWWSVVSRCMA